MTTILRMEPLRPVAEDGEELLEAAASLTVPATAGRGERVLRLWWRLPAAWGHAVQPWADPFVVGLAFPMMQAGAPVRVEGRVSPSLLENLAVAAGFRGSRSPVWWLSTETRRCYYQLENLS